MGLLTSNQRSSSSSTNKSSELIITQWQGICGTCEYLVHACPLVNMSSWRPHRWSTLRCHNIPNGSATDRNCGTSIMLTYVMYWLICQLIGIST